MTTLDACDDVTCTRLDVFSAPPPFMFMGMVVGDSATADCKRKITETQQIIANYKNSGVCALRRVTDKLDDILCPFGTEGPDFISLGQGCDNVDQNCNGIVDECAEDLIPPIIRLTKKAPSAPFKSIAEARKFLEHNLKVTDDCAVDLEIQITDPPDPCTKDCVFAVFVFNPHCIDVPSPGEAQEFKNFAFAVDRNVPIVNCGFFTPQDPYHVSDSFDPCAGETPPYPAPGDPLHINQGCFGGDDLIDVSFWYEIETEECDGVLPISIHVLSNEAQGPPVDDEMAVLLERTSRPGAVHQARVFLAPVSCQDCDSDSSGLFCKAEETDDDSITTRFYDIEISATDAAGRVGTATCSVIVVPENHYECGENSCKGKSGKGKGSYMDSRHLRRRHLESKGSKGRVECIHEFDDLRKEYNLSVERNVISDLSLEWNPELITSIDPPPLPEIFPKSHGKGKGKGAKGGFSSCLGSCDTKGSKGGPP